MLMRYATKKTENGWRLRPIQLGQRVNMGAVRFDGLTVTDFGHLPSAPLFVAFRSGPYGRDIFELDEAETLYDAIDMADKRWPAA